MKVPELLAPAGSWDAFVAAVEAGADAVYMGGKLFSARRFADNFSDPMLGEAVEYAHLRNVKVHVTLNTLTLDTEAKELVNFASMLHDIGVDAVIVQDLGVVKLLRNLLPGLPVHASTQMTVHNSEGARFARNLGCERVVLARELSIAQMAEIKRQVPVEIEAFVHGALCFAYSGQCLMSSLIGGRSGNRGMCAQPCRMEYQVVEGPSQLGHRPPSHLLSCKDLSGINRLPDLFAAGVDSLKIEGRMKRPEYVATVVRVYRKALDLLAVADWAAGVTEKDRDDLAQIFNREFTEGYLMDNPGSSLITYVKPNNRGLSLGTVEQINSRRQRALVRIDRKLRVGDWIEYEGAGGLVVRFIDKETGPVEQAEAGEAVWLESVNGVSPKGKVFKTSDVALLAESQSYYQQGFKRKIPVFMAFEARLGEKLKLSAWDMDGNAVSVEAGDMAQSARHRATEPSDVKDKLERLGDTPFVLREAHIAMDDGLMVPFSLVNNLRRDVIAQLAEKRLDAGKREPVGGEKPVSDGVSSEPRRTRTSPLVRPSLTVKAGSWSTALSAWENGADVIYLGGEVFDNGSAELLTGKFWKSVRAPKGKELIVNTPRIIHDGEMDSWKRLVLAAMDGGASGVLSGNLGLLYWASEQEIPLFGDFYLNVFNHYAAELLHSLGVHQLALSVELTLEQMEGILTSSGGLRFEAIVHGDLPMMVTEHCVICAEKVRGGAVRRGECVDGRRVGVYGLKDRKDMVMPVEVDQDHRCHIFNGAELNVSDSADRLWTLGLASWRIEGPRYSAGDLGRVVRGYRSIIDSLAAGRAVEPALLEEIDTGRSKTRGHYFRGVN